jgi:hypothetical protein
MNAAVQLSFEARGLDPGELARLSIYDRIEVYRELGLSPEQREAAETAVRLIVVRRYRRGER